MDNNAYGKKTNKPFIAVILVMIFVPVLLFFIIGRINFSQSGISSEVWMQFLGSYLGGAISGISTIVALVYTLSHYKQEYELTQRQISFSTREAIRQRIVDCRPYFKITESRLSSEKQSCNDILSHGFDEYVYLNTTTIKTEGRNFDYGSIYKVAFELKNIGNGPALNIRIVSNPAMAYRVEGYKDGSYGKLSCDLAKGETVLIQVDFHVLEDQRTWGRYFKSRISCQLSYFDIYGNEINQVIMFTIFDKSFTIGNETPYYVETGINELVMK